MVLVNRASLRERREVETRERELHHREGIVTAQQELMFSAIKVKHEWVQESSEDRVSQFKGLSVEASSQAAHLAMLYAQLQEVVRKVQEVKEGMECSACLEHKATTALKPLRTLLLLSSGLRFSQGRNLSVCRAAVQSRTHFFSGMSECME